MGHLIQPSGSNGLSQRETLQLAAKQGDVKKIHEILANHAKEEYHRLLFSEIETIGELPLHSAARCGHLDALALLLPESLQGFINVQTKKGGSSALHLATICGHTKVVEWLVESRRANVNLQDEGGFTPLHLAVAFGHKEVVRFLVSQEANLFVLDKQNMFPGSFCKDSYMFDALLSNGFSYSPSFNKVDAENRTYLHYAAEYGSDAELIARLISEADQDQVYVKDRHGDSFLHVAAKTGNMKVLQALKAFDIARLLNNGEHDPLNSPGMYALFYDHRKFLDELVTLSKVEITLSSIIQKLLAELIDKPKIQPRLALFANTLPTYLALYAKKDCIFDFLLETNILSLSQWDDEYKRTCLHWAVVDKRIDIVHKLCRNVKLWPGIQGRDGKTALQHAFEQKNHMVMEILSAKPTFKEHEEKLNRDREVYVQALHAILVGAALIASVTFAGWLQLPFEGDFRSLGMKIYWSSNSLSFFTAVATMCVTTKALLPTPSRYVGDIVNRLLLAIVMDAGLLALSLAAVMVAFAAAGFAALNHAHIFAYQVIMWSTVAVGACLCLIVWLAFVVQLCKCTPPKSVLCALMLPSVPFGSSRLTHWLPTCVQNLCIDVGDRSRFGYSCANRSELKALMDEDLVARCASEFNSVTHAPPASNTIPLETMKQLLSKLDVLEKDNFVVKIYKQREADIALKHKNGGAITSIALYYGIVDDVVECENKLLCDVVEDGNKVLV